ncbi:MAG: DUF4198 domain-containing protein [Pikeienuella sp.]
MTYSHRFAKHLTAVMTLAAGALAVVPAHAHEFWLEPTDYSVAVGEEIIADLKNGEAFKGGKYPFIDEYFTTFDVITRKGAKPVPGRRGDYPALTMKAETGGLHVFAYASTANDLAYSKFEKFESFVTGKDMAWVLDAHKERGLPTEKVREDYFRYAKSLVKVGSGAGRDTLVGFPIELVAELNPYTTDADPRFRLYRDRKPMADFEVQVWNIAPETGEVTESKYRTDATGRVTIPRGEGGEFLLNAVQIVEPDAAQTARGVDWISIWGTTTYFIE